MPEQNIVEGDTCPGMEFLRINYRTVDEKGVAKNEYARASLLLCGVCRCSSVMKKRSDGKIVVKCNFGNLKVKAEKNDELFNKLKSLWKLRLEVLEDKVTVRELDSFRKELNLVSEEELEETKEGEHER